MGSMIYYYALRVDGDFTKNTQSKPQKRRQTKGNPQGTQTLKRWAVKKVSKKPQKGVQRVRGNSEVTGVLKESRKGILRRKECPTEQMLKKCPLVR